MSGKIFEISLSPKQSQALNVFLSPDCSELLLGGAKGGGKTVFGCKAFFLYVKMLIQKFGLKPTKFPPVLGFMGRKQKVNFLATTLLTWKRDIPADAYEIKKQESLIVIEKTASILYGGLDDTETIQKFNSSEFAIVWIDQPEECTEGDAGTLRGTMRLTINGKHPQRKILWTPNPVISDDVDFAWLKRDFIDVPKPGNKFIKALYTDNPFLPPDYGETLQKAYGFNPALLSAYKYGEWDKLRAANVIIPAENVKACVNNILPESDQFNRRITVCDVAGGDDDGDNLSPNDETVIYDMCNTRIVNSEIYSHVQEMDTVGRIVAHQKRNKSTVICVDKVGIGSGVYSRLKEIYQNDNSIIIYGFDSRISPPSGIDYDTYFNYKSYAWFKASKDYFSERKCYLIDDPILTSQLSQVTFRFASNGKMQVTPKRLLKKKIGHSPDRAECYIMGIDALQFAKTQFRKLEEKGFWKGSNYVPVNPILGG